MTEKLLRDVGNAEVYAPHADPSPVRRARAFITTERIIVYGMASDRSIYLLLDEAITGQRPAAERGTLQGQLTVETELGLVHVTRGGGCGCGSGGLKALSAPATWTGDAVA